MVPKQHTRDHGFFRLSWYVSRKNSTFLLAMGMGLILVPMTYLPKHWDDYNLKDIWESPWSDKDKELAIKMIGIDEPVSVVRAKLTKILPDEYYADHLPQEGDVTNNEHTRVQH